ncbi:hypothetical protein BUALT_Bualt01G0111600 [Buddleja alternifolia]|uniref:Uncharacterized protein n=1 Tax=Buddleja alternifolia TaxID=168488 RepID=A0AAV6Y7M8_9LAMI|nr:hypothetical protein BUALT_Bualt01G0111600 [Buddleja alternifolia]
MGGLSISDGESSSSSSHTHKVFLLTNYILLGAASSCIFLTLSLRLIPSLIGSLLILLHIITISGAVFGCAAASHGNSKLYGAHMIATVLTAIFQGSVSVLIFTRPSDFLGHLKSYVRTEDGVVILKLAGGLCILIFCLEWVVLTLAFFLNYYAYVDRRRGSIGNSYAMRRSGKVQDEEDLKTYPWPFQKTLALEVLVQSATAFNDLLTSPPPAPNIEEASRWYLPPDGWIKVNFESANVSDPTARK